MNLQKHFSKKSTLVGSAISLVLLTTSAASYAEAAPQEQCAGVVKAGLNDCASNEHVCAGMNTEDGYVSDWVWLPAGTCNKIAGAKVIGKGDPTN